MSDRLQLVQARLGHTFSDPSLLELALTHTSYLQDHPELKESNQRLEFLGDAVLHLVLTETLYLLYPGEREGQLSKRRAALSNGRFLAQLARDLGLDAALSLGASEDAGGGRSKSSLLEDAFEAVIGALYLDSDFSTTRATLLIIYGDLPSRLAAVEDYENPKGRLQEMIQPLHGNDALRYEVVQIHGVDHAREYEVSVSLFDKLLGTGRGSSKKIAEEAAARIALGVLKKPE